jgi:hypothetical protein
MQIGLDPQDLTIARAKGVHPIAGGRGSGEAEDRVAVVNEGGLIRPGIQAKVRAITKRNRTSLPASRSSASLICSGHLVVSF